VAPRLLAADPERALLVIEELPPGRSLATSLVDGDAATARRDLHAYAEAIAAVHVWSRGRPLPGLGPPWWATEVRRHAHHFADVADDVNAIVEELEGGPFRGFVHADLCPDNVRIVDDGACRIFDFEDGAVGSTAIDAAYLLAPFASCWCYAPLPDAAALEAYETAAGVVGPEWERALAAALAGFVLARADELTNATREDREWGLTTWRPRFRQWTSHGARIGEHFPALGRRIEAIHDGIAAEWPEPPPYPAFT
jgi:Ser/Thr protein kinase RdoA (MazF antagonist)